MYIYIIIHYFKEKHFNKMCLTYSSRLCVDNVAGNHSLLLSNIVSNFRRITKRQNVDMTKKPIPPHKMAI